MKEKLSEKEWDRLIGGLSGILPSPVPPQTLPIDPAEYSTTLKRVGIERGLCIALYLECKSHHAAGGICLSLWVIVICQVPEKLNIKIRANKGPLGGHDLWHTDQATAAASPHVAVAGYKNCSSTRLPTGTPQACDRNDVRLRRA